ncbi:MAG: SMP-30/gluconolactonase/LRE family protein, partial [Rikenellaceae bacterium]|nr:SMP-30/gluconolactonase/LRE family protein [Rikenellaceae bacterium]
MKQKLLTILMLLTLTNVVAQQRDHYRVAFDPATVRNEEVAAGEVLKRSFNTSEIYPITSRDYWIYIPAAYDASKPACLFVCLDGITYNAPTVFDNLIATGQMPVTIGVFVSPGVVRDADGGVIRYNRSNEFDRTDGTFAKFLIEELLPEVERQTAADGRPIRLSTDPNDCAIAGSSSGGICAFSAAWARPDRFARVFSAVGTYVSMRGGNEYQAVIRKTEPKRLRIFLQDGLYDVWNGIFGDWYEANILVESALNFSGYEVAHAWGRGGHSNAHADRIFPDVMRWLWKGWPRSIQVGKSQNDMLAAILPEEGGWSRIEGANVADKLFVYGDKVVFADGDKVCDTEGDTQLRLKANERLIGADAEGLYLSNVKNDIIRVVAGRRVKIASAQSKVEQLIATDNLNRYFMCENSLVKVDPKGVVTVVNDGLKCGSALAIYPNHRLLICNEPNTRWLLSYVLDEQGDPMAGQRFYWLHNTTGDDSQQVGQMTFDENGNLYVATSMGVQVCDQNGRVRAILPLLDSAPIRSLAFVGTKLYVVNERGEIYVRELKVSGAQPWQTATS